MAKTKMKRIGLGLLMGFSLFASCAKKAPELEFWTWFTKIQDMLFNFEKDQERTFDKLSAAMHKVHPDLTFEFGPVTNGTRDFVISADGLKTGFPAVESLYASAPTLPRWRFIKFRPRRSPMELRFGELTIQPSDIEVAVEADGDKAGFTVFVRGFDKPKEKQFSHAAYIILDQAIGEYDMETKVGFITIRPFDAPSQYRRHNLTSLPTMFDEFMKR